ncbi:periplasmic heavy metal sensor [Sphingosinicella sp.]|uniref:periplasmic heavy metal sensor n=1 Tax=Sphingosinicella sp. TaxID=1917971 RepID=UPI0018133BC6|nr:periplasmic heavy metal sensor [Sphingosinicella sp.]MBA4759651.1 periplasmic heavy metal sensor [Sphingosinicella sp.]
MGNAGRYLLVALISAAVALGTLWASRSLLAPQGHSGGELHAFVHQQLDLDREQEARIEALEVRFASRRAELEATLGQANAELARAMASEHQYGPRVAAAVDHAHMAMGDLQKATLEHVFAMRALLRPDQAVRFDRAVDKALTEAGGG